MALLELLSLLVELMTKPFLLVRLPFQFGLRSICFLTQTWIELLRAILYVHLVVFWKLAILAITMLSLPFRAFAALYRERMLEMQLHRMKTALEDTLFDWKELKEQLQIAIRERKMMEVMLMELEDEHDEAILKIELLLGEVRDLKDEIRRLKEVEGKALWNNRCQADIGNGSSTKNGDHFRTPLWRLGCAKDTSRRMAPECGLDDAMHDLVRLNTKDISSTDLVKGDDILARQREVALSRSIFSAIMSLVVGIIAWEAEDPCIPLVVALFTVVSMSLMSVIRFLSTIEHKPASDAVALLSFNWFVLGTLAYPTLPKLAPALAPLAWRLLLTFKGLAM